MKLILNCMAGKVLDTEFDYRLKALMLDYEINTLQASWEVFPSKHVMVFCTSKSEHAKGNLKRESI